MTLTTGRGTRAPRRRVRNAVFLALLALAASPPAGAAELWRSPPGGGGCDLELYNPLGGVRIRASADDPTTVVRGAAELVLAAAPSGGRRALSVARRDGTPAAASAGEVEVAVAPGCEVTVRTTGGAVGLEVGRQAFAATVDTVTGEITARVDPAADVALVFATSGEITTDFSVEIDYRYHVEPAKHGRLVFAPARQPGEREPTRLRLTSRRGAVRLLRPVGEGAAN